MILKSEYVPLYNLLNPELETKIPLSNTCQRTLEIF